MLPPAEAIEGYLQLSRDERWFSNFGPCAELLRTRLAGMAGRPCVVVANATLGLITALAALCEPRSGRGRTEAPREVLVPSFAFAASAQAAIWNGLRPVFVDVAADHWHMDPDALDAALDSRRGSIAAVIALSSLGVPPPPEVRERWESKCRRMDVPLIVDSAAGFGARASDGVPIGGQGDIEVVSFHALKPLSAGEGGAVFCRDEDVARTVTDIANFAFDENHQSTRAYALNAKISEPTAAIALASLDELDTAISIRRERAKEILDLLPERFDQQAGSELGTWQFVPVVAPDAITRKAVREEGERREIGVRTYYDPLHLMPAFADCDRADHLHQTRMLGQRVLSLPMALDLDSSEIAAIGEMVGAGMHAALGS
jgi:dTDP-4-amino-4,6-dideoxygalactose transaminase